MLHRAVLLCCKLFSYGSRFGRTDLVRSARIIQPRRPMFLNRFGSDVNRIWHVYWVAKSWSLPPRNLHRHYDCYCDGLFQYLAGIEDSPFRQKGGSLNTSDIFIYGDINADNEVSLTEKKNEFKVTFGLYDPRGDWHKSSGFKFECFSDNFQPSDYPTQLCGNPPPPPPHHHHHYHHHHRDISLARRLQ